MSNEFECRLNITTMHFVTANEFLTALVNQSPDAAAPEFRSPWVYRGHADSNWVLQCAAWRADGIGTLAPLKEWLRPRVEEALTSVLSAYSQSWRKSNFDSTLQTVVEVSAVRQFCRLADEIGINVPEAWQLLDYPEAIECAANGVNFMSQSRPQLFVDIPFAFAQHHGVPTRYLDWTLDPLMAAFFAAGVMASGESPDSKGELCVYALRRDGQSANNLRWVTVPRSGHHYLHAQHGLFSLHDNADEFHRRFGRWPMLRDAFIDYPPEFNRMEDLEAMREPRPIAEMRCFVLPRSQAAALRQALFERRISQAHLMPTLDHVAAEIRQRWQWYES